MYLIYVNVIIEFDIQNCIKSIVTSTYKPYPKSSRFYTGLIIEKLFTMLKEATTGLCVMRGL